MKKQISKGFGCLIVIIAIQIFQGVNATAGVREGGGGDIQCDALIKKISANIQDWIAAHGPALGGLNLSSSMNPITKTPYTYFEYDSAMLSLLKLPVDSSCVVQGDAEYPVMVGGAAKTCETFVDTVGVHMICDRQQFLGLSPDQQIEQIHHEFAINVPGLEPDRGPISSYKISEQLSADISDVTDRRLTVQRQANQTTQTCTVGTFNGEPALIANGMVQVGYGSVRSVVADLKNLQSTGACTIIPVECSASSFNGEPAISVNGSKIVGYGNINSAVDDLEILRNVGACSIAKVSCSLGAFEGNPAVYINGEVVVGYGQVRDAAKDLMTLRNANLCSDTQ